MFLPLPYFSVVICCITEPLKKLLQEGYYNECVFFVFKDLIYYPLVLQAHYKETGTGFFFYYFSCKSAVIRATRIKLKKLETQIYREVPSNQTILISLKVFK